MLKKPLSFTDQLKQLKAHNIEIKDDTFALNVLNRISYYRLSGYAISFRAAPSNSDCNPGTTFDAIYRIYAFDEELRGILRRYLEIIEVYYRSQIAYGFVMSKCQAPPHNQHYDRKNYYKKIAFDNIMQNFNKHEKNYYKDSLIVKHHNAKYNGEMPLWVILELLSFSNMSKLYSSMYPAEQSYIASQSGISPKTLTNHLHCLSVLRNKCSHGARLYDTDFYPAARLGAVFLRKHSNVTSDSLFSYILITLRRLPEATLKQSFCNEILNLITSYNQDISLPVMGFPHDYVTILKNNV